MDIVTWLLSAILTTLGFAWSLIWFLIGGWVSTLLQIAVLIIVIYGLKYGWRRAPFEIWRRSQAFARFFWNWLRAGELEARAPAPGPETIREIRVRQFGDVNLSTILSLAAIVGALMLRLT